MLCFLCLMRSSLDSEPMFTPSCHIPPELRAPQHPVTEISLQGGPGQGGPDEDRRVPAILWEEIILNRLLPYISNIRALCPPFLLYFLEKNCASTEGNTEVDKYVSANLSPSDNQWEHFGPFPSCLFVLCLVNNWDHIVCTILFCFFHFVYPAFYRIIKNSA